MIAEIDSSLVISAAFQLASAVASVGRVKTRSMSYRSALMLWRSTPSRLPAKPQKHFEEAPAPAA
jgi:hypothetical protein